MLRHFGQSKRPLFSDCLGRGDVFFIVFRIFPFLGYKFCFQRMLCAQTEVRLGVIYIFRMKISDLSKRLDVIREGCCCWTGL